MLNNRQFGEQLQMFDPGPPQPVDPLTSDRNPQKRPPTYSYEARQYGSSWDINAIDEDGQEAGYIEISPPENSFYDEGGPYSTPDRPNFYGPEGEQYGDFNAADPRINTRPPKRGVSSEIGMLWVNEKNRGQGIAHNLLREAMVQRPDADIRHSGTLSSKGLAYARSRPEARFPKQGKAVHLRTPIQSSLLDDDWKSWRDVT
jgi:hypothetical protein